MSHIKYNSEVCTNAAKKGDIETLKLAQEAKSPYFWNCVHTVQGTQMDTLIWLCSQKPQCPWNTSVCTKAAETG